MPDRLNVRPQVQVTRYLTLAFLKKLNFSIFHLTAFPKAGTTNESFQIESEVFSVDDDLLDGSQVWFLNVIPACDVIH